jgi:iron-sulfur cluster insertion protein
MTNIIVTEAAVSKFLAITEKDSKSELNLRVFVTGGGCNGFSYGFTIDDEVCPDDTLLQQSGINLVVDSMSFPYLAGAKVDYSEDLNGARFYVDNPNASSTCGCGNSFSV